ncbi:hypothetical protein M407DRAFT_9328 [Tulasnella calospora MUT 4182]|uniref:Uncharacterized protein n=1 Tax=Tulasnella calospora MUT 4182 TaxID=1051891 RepID=A0A0C3LQH5_9AGAM|nr:hypothetical protein M407DRAFT_9328 [Tulasnella calospora MUT 4182]
MSQANAPATGTKNGYRPLSHPERLDVLLHGIVNEMIALHAGKMQSDQGHPIEQFHGDNRVQTDCVRQFRTFEKRVFEFDHRLHEFEREVRRLGSSSGLIRAAYELRKHLLQIFEVFRSDSESIYLMFGEKTHCEIPDALRPHLSGHPGAMAKFKREIPELLKELSDDLDEVLDSLLEIPEFTDKRLPDSICAFQGWLEYRADGLEDFKGSCIRIRNLSFFS